MTVVGFTGFPFHSRDREIARAPGHDISLPPI
jgi:hypothetical protein